MKKCLKCGVEYRDDDVFCPVCGERLTATDVCQRCGKPVSVEETYCRHCGYKIEKEIKCEQCGAVLDADAKFCQQCGAKVENPVVAIKERKKGVKNDAGNSVMNPIVRKILFFVFGGTLVFLLSLMLLGCFGDIAKANMSISRPASVYGTQGISYFFGDAIKAIEQAGELDKPDYKNFLIIQFVFEIILWLVAMALFIFGIAYGAVQLVKGSKNEFRLNTKPFVGAVLGGLPYLFIFALKCRTYVNYVETGYSYGSSSASSYHIEEVFGWGTQLILVCTILGVITLVAYNVLTAVFERKDIVSQAIRGGVVFPLIVALLASIGLVISFTMKQSGVTADGTTTPYALYTSALESYSSGSSREFPSYAALCFFGYFFMIFGYSFVQATINNLFNEKKGLAPVIINALFAIVLMIMGCAFGVAGAKESVATTSSSSSSSYSGSSASSASPYHFFASAGVIITIVFLVIAVAGAIVAQRFQAKTQAEAK